jgi:hypothetical protein
MITAKSINASVRSWTRAVFNEPFEVLACADLDDDRKRQILECWR